MIDVIRPKPCMAITSIVAVVFALLSGLYIYVTVTGPVIGYCNTFNCTCVKTNTLGICESYVANVFYRYYLRSEDNKDIFQQNVKVEMCVNESVCYIRKYSDRNFITFLDPMMYTSITYSLSDFGYRFLGMFLLSIFTILIMVKKTIKVGYNANTGTDNFFESDTDTDPKL